MVRAKFKCESITKTVLGDNIVLVFVYSDDPNSENAKFFRYTPSGQITMGIVNPSASNEFVAGAEYYIDFTKCE